MSRKIGVIMSYLMMIFEVLSTLLLTPLILNKLGQAEYGVYKLSASITSYLLLLDLGVGNAVIKYVSKYNEVIENEEAIFLGKSNNNVYKESVLCVSDECFVLSISHEMFYQYIHIEKEAIYKKHFEYLMNNVLFNGMTMNVNKFKKDCIYA